MSDKYRRGFFEHGGDLLDLSAAEITKELTDEMVDGLIFSLAIKKLLK